MPIGSPRRRGRRDRSASSAARPAARRCAAETRPGRSAVAGAQLDLCRRPSGVLMRITSDARSRRSSPVHSAICHSLVACADGAPTLGVLRALTAGASGFRMPSSTPFGSRCCCRMKPDRCPAVRRRRPGVAAQAMRLRLRVGRPLAQGCRAAAAPYDRTCSCQRVASQDTATFSRRAGSDGCRSRRWPARSDRGWRATPGGAERFDRQRSCAVSGSCRRG